MLNPSTKEKLLQLADRRQEVNVLLSDPDEGISVTCSDFGDLPSP